MEIRILKSERLRNRLEYDTIPTPSLDIETASLASVHVSHDRYRFFQDLNLFVYLCLRDGATHSDIDFDLADYNYTSCSRHKPVIYPRVTQAVPAAVFQTVTKKMSQRHSDAEDFITWKSVRKQADGTDLPKTIGGFVFAFSQPISWFQVEFCAACAVPTTSEEDRADSDTANIGIVSSVSKYFHFVDTLRETEETSEIEYTSGPHLCVVRRKPTGILTKRQCYRVFKHLRELSENGGWLQCETVGKKMLQRVKNQDLRVLIMQELAVCRFFKGDDFSAVDRMLNESLHLLESYDSKNYNVLFARGLATLSAVRRRRKDYSRCQEYIDLARQLMATVDCDDVAAKLEYNQAVMLANKARALSLYDLLDKETGSSLGRCADLGRRCNFSYDSDYERLLMYIRSQIIMAEFVLRSSIDDAPSNVHIVNEVDSVKAKTRLDEAGRLLLAHPGVGVRFQIRHKIALADWHIKRESYRNGFSIAKDALALAKKGTMMVETLAARLRRDYCHLQLVQSDQAFHIKPTTFITTESSEDILEVDDDEEEALTEELPKSSTHMHIVQTTREAQNHGTIRHPEEVCAHSLPESIGVFSPTVVRDGPKSSVVIQSATQTRVSPRFSFSASHCHHVIQGNEVTVNFYTSDCDLRSRKDNNR